jgi:hypothetical protein
VKFAVITICRTVRNLEFPLKVLLSIVRLLLFLPCKSCIETGNCF